MYKTQQDAAHGQVTEEGVMMLVKRLADETGHRRATGSVTPPARGDHGAFDFFAGSGCAAWTVSHLRLDTIVGESYWIGALSKVPGSLWQQTPPGHVPRMVSSR